LEFANKLKSKKRQEIKQGKRAKLLTSYQEANLAFKDHVLAQGADSKLSYIKFRHEPKEITAFAQVNAIVYAMVEPQSPGNSSDSFLLYTKD
jgi:hypothetical protein